LKIGEEVNIETDLLGKYVEKMLKGLWKASATGTESSRIDTSFLQKHGFF